MILRQVVSGSHFQVASAALWLLSCSNCCVLSGIAVWPDMRTWPTTRWEVQKSVVLGQALHLFKAIYSWWSPTQMAEPGPARGILEHHPKLLHLLTLTSWPRKALFVFSTHESYLEVVLESLYMHMCVCETLLFVLQSLSQLSVCVGAFIGKGDSVFGKQFLWNCSARSLESVVNTEMNACVWISNAIMFQGGKSVSRFLQSLWTFFQTSLHSSFPHRGPKCSKINHHCPYHSVSSLKLKCLTSKLQPFVLFKCISSQRLFESFLTIVADISATLYIKRKDHLQISTKTHLIAI